MGLSVISRLTVIRFKRPVIEASLASRRSASNVARGRAYEIACQSYLQNSLFMDLNRSGSAGDEGIDLVGSWNIGRRLDVVVQCKHFNKKVGPSIIREIDGTIAHFGSYGSKDIIGVICGLSGFTEASWQRAASSKYPILLLHLGVYNEESPGPLAQGRCIGVWKNAAFEKVTNGCMKVQESIRFTKQGHVRQIDLFVTTPDITN